MSVTLNTQAMKYRETTADEWAPVVIQTEAEVNAVVQDTEPTGSENVWFDTSDSSEVVVPTMDDFESSINQLSTNVGKILPVITGTTNNSGYTIAMGNYFEANGVLYKATQAIPTGGAWASSATAQTDTAINSLMSSVDSNVSKLQGLSGLAQVTTVDMSTYKTLTITHSGYDTFFVYGTDASTPTAFVIYQASTGTAHATKLCGAQASAVSFAKDGSFNITFANAWAQVTILCRRAFTYTLSA